jgi:cyclopropane-fatty-acyl-phospholipid synthase
MIFSRQTSAALALPSSYSTIRPHHLALLYPTYHLLSLFTHRYLDKLSTFLADQFTTLLSNLSDLALPLLYSKYTSLLLPDALIRLAIRTRCQHTLLELRTASITDELQSKMSIVKELHEMPIAIETTKANEQHYEVPAKFYTLCLGPNKKYSSGLWTDFQSTKGGLIKENGKWLNYYDSLQRSEEAMLDLYIERAQIVDGMKVVDLGCGWGSLTLHLMKRFPNIQVTSISNSNSQREYIYNCAKERGYNVEKLRVITCDVSRWDDETYAEEMLRGVVENDRVLSIEM